MADLKSRLKKSNDTKSIKCLNAVQLLVLLFMLLLLMLEGKDWKSQTHKQAIKFVKTLNQTFKLISRPESRPYFILLFIEKNTYQDTLASLYPAIYEFIEKVHL